jgi:hypothetical protein
MIDPVETTAQLTPEQAAVVDALIVSCAPPAWTKIAVLIARVTDAAKEQNVTVTPQQIAARIYVLAEAQKLAVQGNVRRWRAGEVRAAR